MLTLHPAGEVPVKCLCGSYSPRKGVVRSFLATGTALELSAGMFLGIQSDFEGKRDLAGPQEDQV